MIILTIAFLGIISLSQAITIRNENSLMGPYTAEGQNLVNWDLTGSAQLGGPFIRLTTEEENKQGAIWNNFPSLTHNWEFQVQFHIYGKGVYLNGDGMAIWYVSEADVLKSGPVFGSKDYFSGLGVFIDTFANQDEPHKHRHPYISAMVNNGSLHYEHDEDGTVTQIGGCHAAVRNLQVPTKIAISYINNALAVYVDNEGLGQWWMCFKSEGVYLPTGYFFGVSASTSEVTDNHDVIALTLLNLDPENMEWVDNSHIIPHAENVQIPLKYKKEFIEKENLKKEEKKREIKGETETKDKTETEEATTEEDAASTTSLWRKLIYITGAILIILVSISMYKKYSEKRRERMEKRLY